MALYFQRQGITALTYDPRNLGQSDGTPRHEIDPVKQVSDYSDALTFLSKSPLVDPLRIAFWGLSFSGSIAACAAALDKRAKPVIMVCPLLRYYTDEKRAEALVRTMVDRVSQMDGDTPFPTIPFDSNGDNPAGMCEGGGLQAYDFTNILERRRVPHFLNQTTIQSYYKIAMWQPWSLFEYISPTPVMMLIPEKDVISKPEDQKAVFDKLQGPKRLCLAPERGHLDILSGPGARDLMKQQVDFMNDVFASVMFLSPRL